MIKRIAYIGLLLFAFATVSTAQSVNYKKSIGAKMIGINFAMVDNDALGCELSLERKIGYSFNYAIGGKYFEGATSFTKFRSYSLENMAVFEYAQLGESVILGGGIKLNMGLEKLNSEVEPGRKELFTIGTALMLKNSFYIASRVAVNLEGAYYINFKSEIFNSYPQVSIGIKYIIF